MIYKPLAYDSMDTNLAVNGATQFTNFAGHINKQIKQDRWFLDNESQVEKSLQSNTELFKSLSEGSQTILARDGKISLNNIDQFPKNDLRLVRRTISKDNKIKRLSK